VQYTSFKQNKYFLSIYLFISTLCKIYYCIQPNKCQTKCCARSVYVSLTTKRQLVACSSLSQLSLAGRSWPGSHGQQIRMTVLHIGKGMSTEFYPRARVRVRNSTPRARVRVRNSTRGLPKGTRTNEVHKNI
jgi:hypothetical protein